MRLRPTLLRRAREGRASRAPAGAPRRGKVLDGLFESGSTLRGLREDLLSMDHAVGPST